MAARCKFNIFQLNCGLWFFAVSDKTKSDKKDSNAAKDDNSGTLFQKQRVDMLLAELLRKFPPPIPPMLQNFQQPLQAGQVPAGTDGSTGSNPTDIHATGPLDIATESIDMKPPPEKKTKWTSLQFNRIFHINRISIKVNTT